MINLDDRYHSYLGGTKSLRIDGVDEKVKSYGWMDDGKDIVGHYVITDNYKLHYNIVHEVHTFPDSNQCQNLYKKCHHHQEVLQLSL